MPGSSTTLVSYFTCAWNKTIDKSVSKIRYNLFVANFPSMSKFSPDVLKELHVEFVKKFRENMKQELELIFKEEKSLIPSLNSLDELRKNPTETSTWRPSGSASTDLCDHLYSEKIKHVERLKSMLNDHQAEIDRLRQQVSSTDEILSKYRGKILKKSEDIESVRLFFFRFFIYMPLMYVVCKSLSTMFINYVEFAILEITLAGTAILGFLMFGSVYKKKLRKDSTPSDREH